MARSQNDVIDFAALERELHGAIDSEQRHKRENEAKLRAIDQRVSSYEQFRWVKILWDTGSTGLLLNILRHLCVFKAVCNVCMCVSGVWSSHLT